MIHQNGSTIVDGQGKSIKLRGVLLEGWVFWPWKRVPQEGKRYRHLMEIRSTSTWDAVRNWVVGVWFAPKPNRKTTLEGMQEFIDALNAENLLLDAEMGKIIAENTNV